MYQYEAVNESATWPRVGATSSHGPTVDGGGSATAIGDTAVATVIAVMAAIMRATSGCMARVELRRGSAAGALIVCDPSLPPVLQSGHRRKSWYFWRTGRDAVLGRPLGLSRLFRERRGAAAPGTDQARPARSQALRRPRSQGPCPAAACDVDLH